VPALDQGLDFADVFAELLVVGFLAFFDHVGCDRSKRNPAGPAEDDRTQSHPAEPFDPLQVVAMPNKWLHEQLGLLSLKQLWCDLALLRGTA